MNEEEDRYLIQRLRETGIEAYQKLADVILQARESPQEVLDILDQLRPVLGDEKSFRSLDEFLRAARELARSILAKGESSDV